VICYRLRCADGHEFEGWFRSSDAFGTQAATGLLSCPQCGSADVTQALMAPAVVTSAARAPVPASAGEAGVSDSALPDSARALLMRVRAEIERTCDDVGDRFATEMMQMHRGEAEQRAIYGQATPEEQETLHEQGIEFGLVPWLPRADS